MKKILPIALALGFVTSSAHAQPIPVTVDNFVRAESDLYLGNIAKQGGGLGKLFHRREPSSIADQTVIRLNRDTLYSSGVFDLDAGPVTVTMPDAGARFMSLMSVSQDHYATTVYGAGTYIYDKGKVGTRYVLIGVRTFADPNDPKDLAQVHALQDSVKMSQGGTGTLDMPVYDPESQKKLRDALLVLGSTMPDFSKAFGSKSEVDPVRHLIGAAMGWGGNPDKDAVYLNVTPAKNDGATVYKLNVGSVPVDAFWSVSLYNAKGFYEKNAYGAYSINSVTGRKGDDGAVAIQFGGCDGNIPNCLPIMKGWNYTVRLYRARPDVLSGKWKFPEAQPAT